MGLKIIFLVFSFTNVIAQIENCQTLSECHSNLTTWLQPLFNIDLQHQHQLLELSEKLNNCPNISPLSPHDPCVQRQLGQMNQINAAGLENLLVARGNVQKIQCQTAACHQARADLNDQVESFAFSYAVYCGDQACEDFMKNVEAVALSRLVKCESNCQAAYVKEICR